MQKLKTFLAVILTVAISGLWSAVTISANNTTTLEHNNLNIQSMEVLKGTIEVICEGSEVMDGSMTYVDRFYITEADKNSGTKWVYLEGMDFAPFVGKEISLLGNRRQSWQSLAIDGSPDEAFLVKKIVDPTYGPTTNLLTMPPETAGNRTTLVMPIQFTSLGNRFSPTQYNQWIFGDFGYSIYSSFRSIKDYFQKVFKGRFNLTGVNNAQGDVTETITLDMPTENCSANMGNAWREAADNAAEAQGFLKVNYLTRIYLFPSISGCSLTASATQGVLGNQTIRHVFLQTPSSGNFDDLVRFVTLALIHEIGHNLGFVHSEGGGFTANHPADPMGGGMTNFHGINLLKAGILKLEEFYPVMKFSGTYTLYLQSPLSNHKRGHSINSPAIGAIIETLNSNGTLSGKHAFIGTRISVGIDSIYGTEANFFSYGPTYETVNSDLTSFNSRSELIDSTPATPCCGDAPIVPDSSGTKTWVYGVDGVTVKVWTVSRGRGTRVEVTLDSRYPSVSNLADREYVKKYSGYKPLSDAGGKQ